MTEPDPLLRRQCQLAFRGVSLHGCARDYDMRQAAHLPKGGARWSEGRFLAPWPRGSSQCLHACAQSDRVDADDGDNNRYNLLVLPKNVPAYEAGANAALVQEMYSSDGSNCIPRQLAAEYGSIADAVLPLVRAWLTKVLGSLVSQCVLRNPSLVASRPGCSRQAPHTDFALDSRRGVCLSDPQALRRRWSAWRRARVVPMSVIVAVQPKTRLWVWKRSHELVWYAICTAPPPERQSEAQLLELDVGMAVIFTGATVHAGAGLEADAPHPHVRVHVYVDIIYADSLFVQGADGDAGGEALARGDRLELDGQQFDDDNPFDRHPNTTGLVAGYGARTPKTVLFPFPSESETSD